MISALLLVGSPKRESTSRVLGEALLAGLAARGWGTRSLDLPGLLDAHGGRARLLAEFAAADLTILSAPVYVDAPPAPVMRALEFLAGEPAAGPAAPAKRRFAAVFNCGFPETEHTHLCLEVCRLFARDAGLAFAGGLGVGCGGALNGRPLEARGRLTARLRKGLDMAAQALASGQDVPEEARNLASAPLAPRWMYLFLAEAGFLVRAAKRKTLFKLGDKPFRQR